MSNIPMEESLKAITETILIIADVPAGNAKELAYKWYSMSGEERESWNTLEDWLVSLNFKPRKFFFIKHPKSEKEGI